MARILIVEDEDSIRELIEMNLNIAGHECETAARWSRRYVPHELRNMCVKIELRWGMSSE